MQVGEKVTFGNILWRVLTVKNGAALLLSEEMVALRAYHNKAGDITWADSDIRAYLNTEFCNQFTLEEQSRILESEIETADNPWFETTGGETTRDRVFLLSIEEAVCLYFGDSSANLKIPNGKYKYWFSRKGVNNEKRVASYRGSIWWWWLRSHGRKQNKAAYVHGDGNIGIQGNNAQKCNLSGVYHPENNDVRGGVRPALWIALQ